LLVYYHRQTRPKKKQRRFARLASADRRLVRVLSGILRLAVALDRGHSQLVKRVRCVISPERVDLLIDGPGDLELELWAARAKLKPLARVLGCSMTLERAGSIPRAA